MYIQGFFEASHIVRTFLAREYAFCCIWRKAKIAISAAHYKGLWFVAKKSNNELVGFFTFSDQGGIETNDNLLKELLESKIKLYGLETRDDAARILAETIQSWTKSLSEIDQIDCVQPGRNAIISEVAGDFALSPCPDEWKS